MGSWLITFLALAIFALMGAWLGIALCESRTPPQDPKNPPDPIDDDPRDEAA